MWSEVVGKEYDFYRMCYNEHYYFGLTKSGGIYRITDISDLSGIMLVYQLSVDDVISIFDHTPGRTPVPYCEFRYANNTVVLNISDFTKGIKISIQTDITSDYIEWKREINNIYLDSNSYYSLNDDNIIKLRNENVPTDQRIANSVSIIKNLQGENVNRLVGQVKGRGVGFPVNHITIPSIYGNNNLCVSVYKDVLAYLYPRVARATCCQMISLKQPTEYNSPSNTQTTQIFYQVDIDENTIGFVCLYDKSSTNYYIGKSIWIHNYNKLTNSFTSAYIGPPTTSDNIYDTTYCDNTVYITYSRRENFAPTSLAISNGTYIGASQSRYGVTTLNEKIFDTVLYTSSKSQYNQSYINGYFLIPRQGDVVFGNIDGSIATTTVGTTSNTWRGCWGNNAGTQWIVCGTGGRIAYSTNRTSFTLTGTNTQATYIGGQCLESYHIVVGNGYINRCSLTFSWTTTNYCSATYLSGYNPIRPIVDCMGYNNIGYVASSSGEIWSTTNGASYTQKITLAMATQQGIQADNVFRIRVGLGNSSKSQNVLWLLGGTYGQWYVPDVTAQTWTVIKQPDGFQQNDITYDDDINMWASTASSRIYYFNPDTIDLSLYDVKNVREDQGIFYLFDDVSIQPFYKIRHLKHTPATPNISQKSDTYSSIIFSPNTGIQEYVMDYISTDEFLITAIQSQSTNMDGIYDKSYIQIQMRKAGNGNIDNFTEFDVMNVIDLSEYNVEYDSNSDIIGDLLYVGTTLYFRTISLGDTGYRYFTATLGDGIYATDWREISNPGRSFDRTKTSYKNSIQYLSLITLTDIRSLASSVGGQSFTFVRNIPQTISNIQTQDNMSWFYLDGTGYPNTTYLKYNPYVLDNNTDSINMQNYSQSERLPDYYWDGVYLIIVAPTDEESVVNRIEVRKRNLDQIGQNFAGFDLIRTINFQSLVPSSNWYYWDNIDISKKGDYIYIKFTMSAGNIGERHFAGTLEKELSDLQELYCNPDEYHLVLNPDIIEPNSDQPYFTITKSDNLDTAFGKIPWTKFNPLNGYGSDTMLINGLVRDTESELDGQNVSLYDRQSQEFWEQMGYDFNNVWTMNTTDGLPTLKNNPE